VNGECELRDDDGSIVQFLTTKGTKIGSKQLLRCFMNLLKDNPDLARHGNNEELGIKLTGLSSVNMLTRILQKLFGMDNVQNVLGTYHISGLAEVRVGFQTHALRAEEFSWAAE